MVKSTTPMPDDGFTPPGAIAVSAAAIKFAGEFDNVVKRTQAGDWVVAFDWAPSVMVQHGPNSQQEEVGPCLILGAYERHQIPEGFVQSIDGIEFAIKIPGAIWEKSVEHLIDLDETLLFKLVLR